MRRSYERRSRGTAAGEARAALERGIPNRGRTAYGQTVASVCVVVLDPDLAPRDQTAWAFTSEEDAKAVARFLNTRLGDGEQVAWVEVVPLARKLNQKVLRYLDYVADLDGV
jgi:hypothetical protein